MGLNMDFDIKKTAAGIRAVMREPILRTLLSRSNLTEAQLETLLIDLVTEDGAAERVPYELKALLRTHRSGGRTGRGVSRGAFNRTLAQARKNVLRSIYTIMLLAYLGLLDYSIFRPFEEIASRIGDYRRIREVLSGKASLSVEEVEAYRVAEQDLLDALERFINPLVLKPSHSKRF